MFGRGRGRNGRTPDVQTDEEKQERMEAYKQLRLAREKTRQEAAVRREELRKHKEELCGATPSGHVYMEDTDFPFGDAVVERCVGCGKYKPEDPEVQWED